MEVAGERPKEVEAHLMVLEWSRFMRSASKVKNTPYNRYKRHTRTQSSSPSNHRTGTILFKKKYSPRRRFSTNTSGTTDRSSALSISSASTWISSYTAGSRLGEDHDPVEDGEDVDLSLPDTRFESSPVKKSTNLQYRRGSAICVLKEEDERDDVFYLGAEFGEKPSSSSLRSMRNWFFSKGQKKTLHECDLSHLMYLMIYYPQYAMEALTSEESQLRELQRPLCNLYVSKLFAYSDESRSMSLDIILWHVLSHEFIVNKTLPLRVNSSAAHLLSLYVKENPCRQVLSHSIGPVLEMACGHNGTGPKPTAIDVATKVLDTLVEKIDLFPRGLYDICKKIKLLSPEGSEVGIVGGCFFFLRYINPFILNFDTSVKRNEVLFDTARLLQSLCNFAGNETNKREAVQAANPKAEQFFKDNAAKLGKLVSNLCNHQTPYETIDELNKHMQRQELLLDIERCIHKSEMMASKAEPVLLSTSDVRLLVKTVLLLVEHHPIDAEREALSCYTEPISRPLHALVSDERFLGENPYLELKPRWIYAPPLCASHPVSPQYIGTEIEFCLMTDQQMREKLERIKLQFNCTTAIN